MPLKTQRLTRGVTVEHDVTKERGRVVAIDLTHFTFAVEVNKEIRRWCNEGEWSIVPPAGTVARGSLGDER